MPMAASEGLSRLPGTSSAHGGPSWIKLVLDAYTQTMSRSRDERGAFDAAVAIYREQNPSSSEQEARRGVAVLICGDR
jgi:hypothetical protein